MSALVTVLLTTGPVALGALLLWAWLHWRRQRERKRTTIPRGTVLQTATGARYTTTRPVNLNPGESAHVEVKGWDPYAGAEVRFHVEVKSVLAGAVPVEPTLVCQKCGLGLKGRDHSRCSF